MANNSPNIDAEQKKNSHFSMHTLPQPPDLEYCIYQTLFKSTTSQLLQTEISIMAKSNHLLDCLATSVQKEMQTTQDSLTEKECCSEINGKEGRFGRENRYQSRKCGKNEGEEMSFQQILKEVEEKCSKTVFNEIKGLVGEIKRIRRSTDNEFIKKKLRQKEERIHQIQEQNLTQIFTNARLQKKIQKSKSTILAINQQLENLKKKVCSVDQVQKIKQYLEQKQNFILLKNENMMILQKKIESVLFCSRSADRSCSNCQFVQRLKQSILKYREFLILEGKQMDRLFNRFKGSIFL